MIALKLLLVGVVVIVVVVIVVVVLVWSGLVSGCVWDMKTNDEEKIKNKSKPASAKEPTSHLRLLHHGSTAPLDNHL